MCLSREKPELFWGAVAEIVFFAGVHVTFLYIYIIFHHLKKDVLVINLYITV